MEKNFCQEQFIKNIPVFHLSILWYTYDMKYGIKNTANPQIFEQAANPDCEYPLDYDSVKKHFGGMYD